MQASSSSSHDQAARLAPPEDASIWSRTDKNACMYQGTTGGGPNQKWLVWRRTELINEDRIIQDLPICEFNRRSSLFSPIGGFNDIKTTFWYYSDESKLNVWHSAAPIEADPRQEIRELRIIDSPFVEDLIVDADNPMKEVRHVPQRSRNPGYTHRGEFKDANKTTIARHTEKAIIRAASLQEQVALDQEGDFLESNPIRRRFMIRASRMSSLPSAPGQERSIRWLADTGCPIDLIGLNELSSSERTMIRKIGRSHSLQTANGTATTLGSITADMTDIEEVVDAHVMSNTPSLISIGKRCMEQGYSFSWPAGDLPVLRGPNGREIVLDVVNNVPYLPVSRCCFGSPPDAVHDDIPAVPAPLALPEAMPVEGDPTPPRHEVSDVPASPDDASPFEADLEGDVIELDGHGPLKNAEDWKADAITLRHLMTHLPKNPYCPHCQRAKMENVRLYRKRGAGGHGADNFGDLVTADTMVLKGLRDRGINGEADAVVFYDLATSWIDVMPVMSRSDSNTVDAFNRFAGSRCDVKMMHTDQAKELVSACKELRWIHEWSTPGMPKTNGIIENKVKLVLHGARVLLRQAGLEARWWPYATKFFSVARNIENRGGGSAWSKRHPLLPFRGKLLPFGCLIDFYPVAPKPRRLEKGGVKNAAESNDDGDYWIKDAENECVIRIHRCLRTKLFDPRGTNCPIDPRFLADEALTVINYANGETDSLQSENWRTLSDPRENKSQEWLGETYFQVDVHALEKWGDPDDENVPPSDDEYEPMSPGEIEEALRNSTFDPFSSDHEEDSSSIAPAVPGEEQDANKTPKFAPVAKPGIFLGYRLEPGGVWKGDYYVADLEHFQAGYTKPSVHQVKQIYHNSDEPFVFPMLKPYELRTREVTSYRADRTRASSPGSGAKPDGKREIFDFDEGRFSHWQGLLDAF